MTNSRYNFILNCITGGLQSSHKITRGHRNW